MSTNEQPVTALKGKRGEQAILKGVQVRGQLKGMLANVEVEQRHLNPLSNNIEAVYTFPLPIGAVLLGMEVDIAGQILAALVVEKTAAEQQYEEAITDGNTAVMVQDTGNGLYTMNVGNLQAGETATIRFRFALPLVWQGDHLRFVLPTTIAPRYGNAEAAGLAPWQIPETSMLFEYPFDFSFEFEGDLAKAEIASPSHPISVSSRDDVLTVRLNDAAALDRDLILTARRQSSVQSLMVVPDHDGYAAFASLRVPVSDASLEAPLCLKIVIDCSGSMAGVSIGQARKAAITMLDLLRPKDYFNVTLFGSRHESIFPSMVPGEHGTVALARQRLLTLDADMGGTEMGDALEAAYKISGAPKESFLDWLAGKQSGMQASILLITDGEIWDFKKIVARAKKSQHRVFTVGVGMSSAEGFIKKIASETGAASEFVAPQEGMAERILSQFHRLAQHEVPKISLRWDVDPAWQTPLPEVVFSGDTLHVFAGFGRVSPTQVCLAGQEAVDVQNLACDHLSRVAAFARIGVTDDSAIQLQLALEYQLLTPLTNYLVVAERECKVDDLPELIQVPQMLAAGWGGNGVATAQAIVAFGSGPIDYNLMAEIPCVVRKRNVTVEALANSGVDRYDIPAFLRKEAIDSWVSVSEPAPEKLPYGREGMPSDAVSPGVFLARLNKALAGFLKTQQLPHSLPEFASYGLSDDVVDALKAWEATGETGENLVLAFLNAMLLSRIADGFERGLKRLVMAGAKRNSVAFALSERIAPVFTMVTTDDWANLADELNHCLALNH